MTTRAARSARRAPLALLCVALAALPALAWTPSPEVRERINAEKMRDPSIPGQAAALIRLAWSEDPTLTPEIRASAREELAGYRKHALRPIREQFRSIPARYQADAAEVFIEAKFRMRSGLPSDYVAGLEEFVWYGSREARRVAIKELGRYAYPPAVLTMIDAVHEDPTLILETLRTLESLRDERASLFLARAVRATDPEVARAAARAMASVGGQARRQLRELVASGDEVTDTVRRSALEGLLASPAPDDLSAIHEFIGDHLDVEDDPLLDRARLVAAELELKLQGTSDPF